MRLLVLLLLVGGCKRAETPSPIQTPDPPATVQEPAAVSSHVLAAKSVLDRTLALESEVDVTCWTSFRQFDTFISTGQYSEWGTVTKIAAVKAMTRAAWRSGKTLALRPDELKLQTDYKTTTDQWRVLLSILMDELRAPTGLPEVDQARIEALADLATALSLRLLRASGALAQKRSSGLIEAEHVKAAWSVMADEYGLRDDTKVSPKPGEMTALRAITGGLIKGKLGALRQFNKSSGSLHTDLSKAVGGPLAEAAVKAVVAELQRFAEPLLRGIEPPRADAYLPDGTHRKSKLSGRDFIDVVFAQNATMQRLPHTIGANGDVRLRRVPNPGMRSKTPLQEQGVVLLDYEMNAVRDTALHWQILMRAWSSEPFAMDPFAAEYVSEVISVYATWLLKEAVAGRTVDKRFVFVPPQSSQPAPWTHQGPKSMPTFADATDAAGLGGALNADLLGDLQKASLLRVMGSGIGVGDVNRDGWPDLYLAGEGLGRLYINKEGRFTDATERLGVPPMNDARAALFFEDRLLIVRSHHPSVVLKLGGGVYSAAELPTAVGAHTAAVFDADDDGDLDIYIGTYGSSSGLPTLDGRNGNPNQLFLRAADGSYSLATDDLGLGDVGWALAIGVADLDGDRDQDLYIANDFGPNVLFQRGPDGRYRDIAQAAGVADRGSGMNVTIADITSDGTWEVLVTNIDMFSKRIKIVYPAGHSQVSMDDAVLRSFTSLSGTQLYTRTQRTWRSISPDVFEPGDHGWSWGAVFFDADHDGDDDLYMANGWIEGSTAANQKNLLFVSHGGRLHRGPPSFAGNSRSVAAVDYDRDGDLDLIVNNYRQPPTVLQNNRTAGHWIQLKLEGRRLGAELQIVAGEHRIRRLVTAATGYLGQQDTLVHAGLGEATAATITVRWPDGAEQQFGPLSADQVHLLRRK